MEPFELCTCVEMSERRHYDVRHMYLVGTNLVGADCELVEIVDRNKNFEHICHFKTQNFQ